MATITSATIGYPRIGAKRELKSALEAFWSGKLGEDELLSVAHLVETEAWQAQADAGVDRIGLDSTLYDTVLDFTCTYLGLVPPRFKHLDGLETYFAMARGTPSAAACDMSKWFDTNYHFIVPELGFEKEGRASQPLVNWSPLLEKVKRGLRIVGQRAIPILMGPNTIIGLAKGYFDHSEMLHKIIPAYVEVLHQLKDLGVAEVQVHEPILTLSTADSTRADVEYTFQTLAKVGVPLDLVIYYDDVTPAVYEWVKSLPVAAISLDFCSSPGAAHGCDTAAIIAAHGFPKDKRLGCGIIDGRSIWKDDGTAAKVVASLRDLLGMEQRLSIQTSTSLQHVPLDVELETELPVKVKSRLSFAKQKLGELVAIARTAGTHSAGDFLDLTRHTGAPVKTDITISPDMFTRSESYSIRRGKQHPGLPVFPTTTIGSFPQTQTIRRTRLLFKRGLMSEQDYKERIAAEIGLCIGIQEALGLDVLVHGEPERTDMVEFFGFKLEGFYFTQHGWVQSYGSRYVRPPMIAGDVRRIAPMTVHEYEIAQSLTSKPVKGMLTGPVTILNWSFPRKDIPRQDQAFQIALAIREEVADLEAAGCSIVQVDEPALREGLPLKNVRAEPYLNWAVDAFRLATSVASPSTQVVTHLCYSEFGAIMAALDRLDADVLTIENSRSSDEMIKALSDFGYSKDVGPGVYDIHSPVVPSCEWQLNKIRSIIAAGIDVRRIWVNPDCGLKTRKWVEVIPSLSNMVAAATLARREFEEAGSLAPPQE